MTELGLRPETERSPDVFFVLCDDWNRSTLLGTLYTVQLPSDLSRFRFWDDGKGFDVLFELCGRWHRVNAVWKQLKGRNLDLGESRPVLITTFGRRVLKKTYGVKEWKPKRR